MLDPKQLVFIDETAATTKMTRLFGRTPQGKRLVDKVPHGHWKTTTFICGLRYDDVTPRLCWMARWMDPTSWRTSNRSFLQL
jgi:hypothetical protein